MTHVEEYYARREAAHVKEYVEELKSLRRMMWALIKSQGGEVKVDLRDVWDVSRPGKKFRIESFKDEMSMSIILRALED